MLHRERHPINRKRVRRLIDGWGWSRYAPKPTLSRPQLQQATHPYPLPRRLVIARANQVWSSDIAYLRIEPGFPCLWWRGHRLVSATSWP
ncbi:MAG: hypothetical protein P9E67_05565 [Candidatus Competibacter sp.]|nr:hypothetical protein [Candidatus Competibacter sp.]